MNGREFMFLSIGLTLGIVLMGLLCVMAVVGY